MNEQQDERYWGEGVSYDTELEARVAKLQEELAKEKELRGKLQEKVDENTEQLTVLASSKDLWRGYSEDRERDNTAEVQPSQAPLTDAEAAEAAAALAINPANQP